MKRAVKKGYVWFRASIVFLLIASLLAGAVPPIMPASKAEAKTVAEEFAICTAPSDKREPQIAGNYVVWEDYRSGNADIYGYDLATGKEFAICTTPDRQWEPQIAGNYVVWSDYRSGNNYDNYDIYGYDLATGKEFAICTAPGSQGEPQIAGNYVVWEDYRSGNADIYGYDLATGKEFAICTAPDRQWEPQIAGNYVVWRDDRSGGNYDFSSDIYGYDLATGKEFAICTTPNRQGEPQIAGNYVVWEDYRSGNADIYGYDLATGKEFAICTAPNYQWEPQIAGNYVVWSDYRSGNYRGNYNSYDDIYGYDLATGKEFAICTAPRSQGAPQIAGNYVVWSDYRNVNYDDFSNDIYGYDLATGKEFAICTAPNYQWEPQIAGNYVVWSDYRSGNADIYGAKLTEVPDGPSAPKVTATSPQNGAVGVLPSSDIFAYFNLPMDKKTINQSTVLVSDGTRNIKGDISYRDWTFNDNTVQHILIFHPQEPLPRGQRYTVKLTSDIRTAEEMPRNLTPYTFSFTVDGTTRDQIIDEINSLEKTLYRKVNSTQADVALSYMTVKDTIALREAINGFEMFNEVSAMLVGDIGMDTIVNPDIINNLNNYQKSMAFYAKAISCSKFIVDAKDIDISSQILVSAINNTSRILANISYGEAEYLEGSHAIYGPNVLFNGTDELKTYISVRMFALKESIPQELPANYPADELLKELKSINTALGSSIVRSDQAVVWPYLRNGRKDYQRYAFGGTNDAYSSVLRLAGEIRKGDLRKLSNWSVVKPYAEEATKIVATYFTGGAGYFGIDALFLVAGALSSANEAIETHYTLEKTEGMIKDAYSSLIIFNGEMGAVANLISDLNKYGDYLGGLPKPLSLSVAPASANLAAASLSLASVRVDSLELNDIATEEGMIGGKGVAKIKLANEGISPAKVRVYSKVYPAYSSREIGPLSMLSSALVEVAPQTSAEATVSVSLPKSALFSPAGYIAVFFAEVQEQEGSFPETIGPFTKHFYVGSSSELSVFSSNIKNPLAVGKSIALGESTTETFTASNLAEDVYFILTQPQDADIDLHLFDEEGNHTGINYSSEETETAVPFSTYSGRRGEVEFIRVSGAAGKTFGVSIRGTEVPEGTTFDLYAIEVPKTEALMVTYPLDITVPISDAIDIPIEVKEAGTHASLEDVSLSATDAISPSGSIPASAITFDKNAVAITAGGSETFDMNIVLQEGTVDDTYTADVLIQGKDALSNKVLSSTVKLTLLVDRTAPGAPVLNTPESYTKELPITISGEAEPYSTIMIYSGDERIAMAIALPDGSFSQSVFRLKEGTNEITAIAEDAAGNKSEPSAPVSVFYSLPPATPTNFVATAGDGKVNLSWNPSIGLSIGYNLYRSTSPVLIGDKINTAAITLTSYTDTGLVNGATYYYRVQAVDMFDNESQLSEAVPATPTASSGGGSGGGGGGGSTPPAPTKPAPPTGLKANTNDNMVHLVWNPSKAEDIAGYKVYRKDKASGKVEPLNTTPIKEVQYQDKDANENTVYIYWVTAVDKKGTESEKSNEVEAIRAKKKAAVMFLDIAANAWYKSFVDQLIERNIIGGYPDGTFKPDKTITRAEFAKMVCLAQGWELINPATPSFKDIPKTNWAYSYIETAKKNGALGGYKDGTFKADKNISRAEIAKIVSGALKLSEGRSTLKDVNAHWAKGYIGACANAGIVSGYSDGTFKPNAIAKRSEASKMVAGMINE